MSPALYTLKIGSIFSICASNLCTLTHHQLYSLLYLPSTQSHFCTCHPIPTLQSTFDALAFNYLPLEMTIKNNNQTFSPCKHAIWFDLSKNYVNNLNLDVKSIKDRSKPSCGLANFWDCLSCSPVKKMLQFYPWAQQQTTK